MNTADLFTNDIFGRIAIHTATNTPVVMLRSKWHKGSLSYDVLVPVMENKKAVFCNVTYSGEEIEF